MRCNHNDLTCREYVRRITYLSQSARWLSRRKALRHGLRVRDCWCGRRGWRLLVTLEAGVQPRRSPHHGRRPGSWPPAWAHQRPAASGHRRRTHRREHRWKCSAQGLTLRQPRQRYLDSHDQDRSARNFRPSQRQDVAQPPEPPPATSSPTLTSCRSFSLRCKKRSQPKAPILSSMALHAR